MFLKNRIILLKIIILVTIFFGVFGLAKSSWAATYYVSPSGSASWNQCTNINTPCLLSIANSNVVAGDTVYIRAGTYNISDSGINPLNTGIVGNMITFSSYNGEVVNLVGNGPYSTCVDLDSEYSSPIRSYIKITGINCINFYHQLWIRKGNHNEISYSSFTGMYDANNLDWRGSTIYRNATYNWVHHNIFANYGSFDPNDNSVLFVVGNENSSTDGTSYNLIEDNNFYHSGHNVIDFDGNHNVFRNNYIHNEAWSNYNGTDYGNRVF